MKQINKKSIIAFLLILIIIVLAYLLILRFGYINNNNQLTPTGNIDIFDINCNCNTCKKTKEETTKEKKLKNNNKNKKSNKSSKIKEQQKQSSNTNKKDTKKAQEEKEDLIVSDNYGVWKTKKLRIFSNPAYEYTSKIAPNSKNSYVFVIRNNNNFDINIDIKITEENPYNINMKYKLRNKGIYLAGNNKEYEDVSKLDQQNITLKSKESKSYILDWKWLDSKNDTIIGEKIDAKYKLSVNIRAKQI